MTSLVLCAAIWTTILPGQPEQQASGFDPMLPEAIRAVAAQASLAELDARRGTANAVEILKAEKTRQPSDELIQRALDLRVAATILRAKFLASDAFPLPQRYEQAISTFSRLDVSEPGLSAWLKRSLEHHPDAQKRLRAKGARTIKVGMLLRGSTLDRQSLLAALNQRLEASSVKLELTDVKDAPFVLKFSVEDAPSQGGKIAVRVGLGIERVQDNKVVWQQSLYRVEAAHEIATAQSAAVDWLSRIGGRDLFFRWLGEEAFPQVLITAPKLEHKHGPGPGPGSGSGPAGTGAAPGPEHGGGITPLGEPVSVPTRTAIPRQKNGAPSNGTGG